MMLPAIPGETGDVAVPADFWDTVSVGQIILGVVAILAILGLIWRGFRALARLWKVVVPFENFLRDWNGEDARPGVPAHDGVMVRLASIEERLKDTPSRSEFNALAEIVKEDHALLRFITPAEVAAKLASVAPDTD